MFDYARVAVLIREMFGPAFIEAIRREIVFLNIIEPKMRLDYVEKDIQWKINYAGNSSAGSYTETGSFGTAGEQAYTTARLDWKLNKVVVRVTGLAQRVSQSENSIIDAISQEVESGTKDLKRNMNLQLLSDGVGNINGLSPALNAGGVGADLTGVLAAIDDGTDVPVYAGIDRTVNMWWRSFVLANGGVPRPLTEALMFQVQNEIESRAGKVTHIFCSPNTWTAYGLLQEQERRQVNPGSRLTGGFQTLDFNGIPVVKVPSYAEGRMDFVDMDLMEYLVLQDFAVEPRDPGSFDAAQFFLKHYAQMKYENPWHAGSIRDIQAA